MGKLSRNKGAAFEREIANALKALGIEARRNVQETQLGNNGDVLCANIALSIQCKVGMVPPLLDALDQAEEVAVPLRHMPVAFIRRNERRGLRRARDCVVLRTPDFLRLLEFAFALGFDFSEAAHGP